MKAKIGKYQKNNRKKIDINIEKFDSWNACYTMAYVILPILLQLRDNSNSIPGSFGDLGLEGMNGQMTFDFYQEDHTAAFDTCVKNWEDTLNKMIWSFQQLVHDDYDALYHHGNPKYDWVKLDEQYVDPITGKKEDAFKMVDTNPEEHWYDVKGHNLHEERIQEGLELFGKYYRNLWD